MPTNPDYPELLAARDQWCWQPPENCLAGKAILVTGAGAGIGAAAARTFACYGADVVLLGRTRKTLEAVSDWITGNTATNPVIVPADVAGLNEAAVASLREAIENTFGKLHGVLHNASFLGAKTPIEHYPVNDWNTAMATNVTGPFLLSRGLQPTLERAGNASVVFVSSTVGRAGRAYWGAYSVSKFALEGLSEVLADELENAGRVRVNSLNPGGTRTAMRAAAYPLEDPASVPTPEARMDVFVYLMADASIGVTGQKFDARDWQPPASS